MVAPCRGVPPRAMLRRPGQSFSVCSMSRMWLVAAQAGSFDSAHADWSGRRPYCNRPYYDASVTLSKQRRARDPSARQIQRTWSICFTSMLEKIASSAAQLLKSMAMGRTSQSLDVPFLVDDGTGAPGTMEPLHSRGLYPRSMWNVHLHTSAADLAPITAKGCLVSNKKLGRFIEEASRHDGRS